MHLIRSRLASAPDEDPSAHRRVHVPNVDIDYAKSIGLPVFLHLCGDDWDIPAFRFDLKVRPLERIRANYFPPYNYKFEVGFKLQTCRTRDFIIKALVDKTLDTPKTFQCFDPTDGCDQSCDSSVKFIPRPYDYAHFER